MKNSGTSFIRWGYEVSSVDISKMNNVGRVTVDWIPSWRFLFTSQVLILAFFFTILSTTEGAHSRRRPVVVRSGNHQVKYDRSITTFSPDGQLQQVAYSMEASNRGESVIAALVNETMAIVAARGNDKIHRIDSHIVMVTSGLAGDARALASSLRSSCQRHFLSFGEIPTVLEVAEFAAQMQHDLTKSAGARPLGCTAIIIGVARSKEPNTTQELQIFRSDPGGALDQCMFTVAGKRNQQVLTSLAAYMGQSHDVTDGVPFDGLAAKSVELVTELDGENSPSASSMTSLWMLRAQRDTGALGLRCTKVVSPALLEENLAAGYMP